MIYKRCGEVFKNLRKQKRIPLISFEVLGISKATLGKFECGKSMLGFDRLTLALQYLGVSLEEYELHLNKFVTSELETYSDDIFTAYIKEDQNQLRALSKELRDSEYPFLSTSTQIWLQQLKSKSIESCKEFDQVSDFL